MLRPIKFILVFTLFLLTSSLAFALDKVDLSQHGMDLYKAPFHIRYAFSKKWHKDWLKSTYNEREEFLTQWHLKEAQEAKEKKELAKKEADQEKEKDRKRREKQRMEQEKLKAKALEEKQEAKENKDKKKDFDKKVQDNERILNQLRR